jgi:hypothetical protein
MSAKECFLANFLRVVGIPQHREAHPIDTGIMVHDKLGKRAALFECRQRWLLPVHSFIVLPGARPFVTSVRE